MGRQLCDRYGCNNPAVTYQGEPESESVGQFLCANHAPADVEVHW